MKLILLFFCFFFCPFFPASAQPTQPCRAELPLSNDLREFAVWPQPDSSVLVLMQEKLFRRNSVPFTLLKYNPELVLTWQKPIELPRGSQFLKGTVNEAFCYLIFEGQRRDQFLLASINTQTSSYYVSHHQLPENVPFRITEMQALDGFLFLTGVQNMRVAVLHLDPFRTEIHKIPAIYDQSSALTEFQTSPEAGRAEFILAESNGLKSRLQIKRLAPDGRMFSLNFLQDPRLNYLAGRLSRSDSVAKLIAGTYSIRDLRYAQGFFAGPLRPAGKGSMHYHDFTTFSHFFDYLRPGRQEKIRRKVARFRISDKFYQLRHRVLLHELYPLPGGYLVAGELYALHYQNEGTRRGTFDGYLFTQAVVAAIDLQGKLLWENSFPLQPIKLEEPAKTVTIGTHGNRVMLCYPEFEKIWYKEISNCNSVPNDQFIRVTTLKETDKIYSTYPEGLVHWYRNNFLTYGVQTVRGPGGTRTVFYLNKVSF